MTPERNPVVPVPAVPPGPDQRRPVGEPVSRVDWFRDAPTGGTVFAPSAD